MKKYLAFFQLRFTMGLQYRAAAIAGIITQFAWGFMEILMFRAFYRTNASAFPMTFQATAAYIWMQQAFLALFMTWFLENEIFESIINGNVSYELCRPINIYNMWFARSLAYRLSKAFLRCMPILIVAAFLPAPYGLMLPDSPLTFIIFIFTSVIGLAVTVSFCMLVYMSAFFTISSAGIKMVTTSAADFFSGAVIPLPFFPATMRKVLELLPFASMQNVPFRIYSGDLYGLDMYKAILLQIFWLITLVMIGRLLNSLAMKRITIQGS